MIIEEEITKLSMRKISKFRYRSAEESAEEIERKELTGEPTCY